MTEPASATPTQPTVSFWEDVIDIFISPVAVFRRREHTSAWPPLLFVALTIGVIMFATFNTFEPMLDAEIQRGITKQLAGKPAPPPEQMATILKFAEAGTKYASALTFGVTIFLVGSIAWVLGKLVGSKQTYHAALVVAGWAYMPRILGAALGAVQGLLIDPAKLNSILSISLSPARFMDVETANPVLYQLAGRLDLITIWVTILLAIGMYVTGKVTKGRAAVFGVMIWVVGSLYLVRQAYLQM